MHFGRFAFALLALFAAVGPVQSTIYFPPECAFTCANGSFIEPLPVDTCPTDNADNRAYVWAITALIQTQVNLEMLSPPSVARIAAITGSCLYEAVTLLDKYALSHHRHGFSHFATDRNAFIRDALDGAGFWALFRLFGDTEGFSDVCGQYETLAGLGIDESVTMMREFVGKGDSSLEHKLRSHRFSRISVAAAGAAVCERVIQRYIADGYTPTGGLGSIPEPTDYSPVNLPQSLAGITDCDNEILDPNRWQPLCIPFGADDFGTTRCTPQIFQYPWAGRFTPFALEEGDETTGHALSDPPPQFGTPEFTANWEQVLDFSANLDDADKIVAEYWADGPDTTFPPGHTFKIAADAAVSENLSPEDTARLLFIVGNAVYDAGIASWRTKTTYDFIRPLQMIQCGARGEQRVAWRGPYQGVGLVNASEWRPYQAADFVTPPFSSYVSGHSAFSAAATEAMRLFFGSDEYRGPPCNLIREGESLFEPRSAAIPGVSDIPNTGPETIGYVPAEDVVLCWETFTDASDQAGISRLMGGIHIRADDIAGQLLGRSVGRAVYEKATMLHQSHTSSYD